MIKGTHIFVRFFCLLLVFHIIALNTYNDLYLNLIYKSSISINSNVEEEPDTNSKSSESDNFELDDDKFLAAALYLVNGKCELDLMQFQQRHFLYSSIAFQQVHYEIQIPPPRS